MDSEVEAKVLALCVVSIEGRWLAQASQVLTNIETSACRSSSVSMAALEAPSYRHP